MDAAGRIAAAVAADAAGRHATLLLLLAPVLAVLGLVAAARGLRWMLGAAMVAAVMLGAAMLAVAALAAAALAAAALAAAMHAAARMPRGRRAARAPAAAAAGPPPCGGFAATTFAAAAGRLLAVPLVTGGRVLLPRPATALALPLAIAAQRVARIWWRRVVRAPHSGDQRVHRVRQRLHELGLLFTLSLVPLHDRRDPLHPTDARVPNRLARAGCNNATSNHDAQSFRGKPPRFKIEVPP